MPDAVDTLPAALADGAPIDKDAAAFLARGRHRLLIGGTWRPALSGQEIETRDPSTGRVIGTIAAGDDADIDLAVQAARAAFVGPWRRWSPYERQVLLHRAHDAIGEHWEELAHIESIDMGAPISRTRTTRAAVQKMILYFAAQSAALTGETIPNGLPGSVTTLSIRAPVGVVGGIIPWNGPVAGLWWVVGAALASGCTVVLKPAEDASLSALRTAEILQELGLPPGLLNVVTGLGGAAGAALARHPGVDRIAFTGSTEPPRVCRRPFRLSHAAMAGSSMSA